MFEGLLSLPSWVAGDFDGDGKTDLALFRSTNGRIWTVQSSSGNGGIGSTAIGMPDWLPAMGDYDGDGKGDYSWFVPKTQVWRVYESSRGYAERLPRVQFGDANDIPVPADFDGDNRTDMVLYRRATGRIKVLESATSRQWESTIGDPWWIAVPANYDGDGQADLAWFVPRTTVWRIYRSSRGDAERMPRVQIGALGDVPVPADFDGDGKADVAVFCEVSGKIWVRYSSLHYTNLVSTSMGMPTWLPTVGDYDGDGKADFSWFIPATQTWRVYESSKGYAERLPRVKFGGADDWPLATPLAAGWAD
jgi:hypothetical protein